MICKVKEKNFLTPWKMAFGRRESVIVSSPTRLRKHARGLGFEKGDRIG